jgi:hypothetical protein
LRPSCQWRKWRFESVGGESVRRDGFQQCPTMHDKPLHHGHNFDFSVWTIPTSSG